MLSLHPQFIKDNKGKNSLVVLPAKEFDKLMEELEDAEDVRLYNEAKKNDTGKRIPFEEVVKRIEAKRKINK